MTKTIRFRRASEPGTSVTLTAVGDIMMQGETQQTAHRAMDLSISDPYGRVASGFQRLFVAVRDDLNQGDLLFGNLETPIAANIGPRRQQHEDGRVLCEEVEVPPGILHDGQAYQETKYPRLIGPLGWPNFNAHPALAEALKAVGFDIVALANNHVMDRGHNGIDRTIAALRRADLDFVGVRRSDQVGERDGFAGSCPYVIKETKGVRIAFFSFTQFLNAELAGHPDAVGQVCKFPLWRQEAAKAAVVRLVGQAKADPEVDVVVVSVHWGIDYLGRVLRSQRRLAHLVLEAGADLILGHHSHVLQPMEKVRTTDGRETLVIYSLGNFLTDMRGVRSRSTVILTVGVTKNETGTFLSGVQFLPVARHLSRDERTGHELVRPVAIDRYPSGTFTRHRDRIVRVLGRGNLKDPDASVSSPVARRWGTFERTGDST